MKNELQSQITSVATFQPLWAGCVSVDQAKSVKENLKRMNTLTV
jgi:neutral trehalase